MNSYGVWSRGLLARGAQGHNTQIESYKSQVCTPEPMVEHVENAPIAKGSHQEPVNDAVSQPMLRVLQRVVGAQFGASSRMHYWDDHYCSWVLDGGKRMVLYIPPYDLTVYKLWCAKLQALWREHYGVWASRYWLANWGMDGMWWEEWMKDHGWLEDLSEATRLKVSKTIAKRRYGITL